MSLRLPLQNVGSFTETSSETGGGSVAGGIPHLVTIPQDTDNVVVRFKTSIVGAVSATFQTTPDGGTTWYDVARTSIVSNTPAGFEEWLNIPVHGHGFNSTVIGQTSVAGKTNVAIALNTIGKAPASTLSSATQSGLPLLSPTARVFVIIQGNITSAAANSTTTDVFVNDQSATA